MDCEICGRKNARIDAIIEGVKMRVCEDCAKHSKKIIHIEPASEIKKDKKNKNVGKIVIEHEIVDDYGIIIKSARERKGLTRKELAALIDEKESFLKRIEEEEAFPPEKLARKLENALGIKLIEEIREVVQSTKPARQKLELTFGDIAEIKKKNK